MVTNVKSETNSAAQSGSKQQVELGFAIEHLPCIEDYTQAKAAGMSDSAALDEFGMYLMIPSGHKRDGQSVDTVAIFADEADAALVIGQMQLSPARIVPVYEQPASGPTQTRMRTLYTAVGRDGCGGCFISADGSDISSALEDCPVCFYDDRSQAMIHAGVEKLDDAVIIEVQVPEYPQAELALNRVPAASADNSDDNPPALHFRELTTIIDAMDRIVDILDAADVGNRAADECEARDAHWSATTSEDQKWPETPCASDELDKLVHRRFKKTIYRAVAENHIVQGDIGHAEARYGASVIALLAVDRLRQLQAVLREYHGQTRAKWLAAKDA